MSASAPLSLEHELDVAERKAWAALGRYKFQMFGYWAAVWVHLNRIGGFRRRNPWRSLVYIARSEDRAGLVSMATGSEPTLSELDAELEAFP